MTNVINLGDYLKNKGSLLNKIDQQEVVIQQKTCLAIEQWLRHATLKGIRAFYHQHQYVLILNISTWAYIKLKWMARTNGVTLESNFLKAAKQLDPHATEVMVFRKTPNKRQLNKLRKKFNID